MQHEVLRRRQVISLRFPLLGLGFIAALAMTSCAPVAEEAVVVLPRGGQSPTLVETPSTAEPAPAPPSVPTAIRWISSEQAARALAKSRRLTLIVFLFAEWATPAVQMDRVTWSDPRVLERSPSFVALRLDVSDAGGQAQADADRFDLDRLPSTLIFDPDGDEVGRLEGFATADDVLHVLRTIAPAHD